MSECDVVRHDMPLLLVEALEPASRERAHLHIERCSVCEHEWLASRSTWNMLGELPELPVPPGVRKRFLGTLQDHTGESLPHTNVVPFHRRAAFRWVAQAAAIVLLAGGGYFLGSLGSPGSPAMSPTAVADEMPRFSIAEQTVIPASYLDPEIKGRPMIQNVEFVDDPSRPGGIGISFDLTSRVTVTGDAHDRSVVRLVSQMLQGSDYSSSARSSAIQWVSERFGRGADADPEIVRAMASLLTNDSHEGVRRSAADALREVSGSVAAEAQTALIEALRNDPNPAVRLSAIEALANLARSSSATQEAAIDTLREKAAQHDENAYVRVKAAEALGRLDL